MAIIASPPLTWSHGLSTFGSNTLRLHRAFACALAVTTDQLPEDMPDEWRIEWPHAELQARDGGGTAMLALWHHATMRGYKMDIQTHGAMKSMTGRRQSSKNP